MIKRQQTKNHKMKIMKEGNQRKLNYKGFNI